MYKKIKDFFTINLHWKALSILMAIGIWFIVMNINNPTEIKTFDLNISLLNEEKLKENNLVVLNLEELKNQKAEIKIKGSRTTLDELNKKYNRDNIKLALDLDQLLSYNIGDEPLKTIVNLKTTMPNIQYPNNNFEIVSFYPITYDIYVDKIITIPKKIHPKTTGEIKSGYIASDPELSSEYIQVSGPKSIVDKIQVIYAEVDISNQTSTMEQEVELFAYDKDGNKIDGLQFNMNTVEIKVPISVEGVLNISEPKLIGELPEGYVVNNVTYSTKNVEVIGSTSNLKKLTKITLPEINITGLTQSTEFTCDITQILRQYNLKLKNSNNSKVKINVDIRKAKTKVLTIPTNKISILGYNDNFFIETPEEVSINITGDDNIIDSINQDLIKCNIDVTGLDIGEHNIKINVDTPENIKLVSQPYINIVISEKDENTYNEEDTTEIIEIENIEQLNEVTTEINSIKETTEQTETTTNTK